MSAVVTTYETRQGCIDCIELELKDTFGNTIDTKLITENELQNFINSGTVSSIEYDFQSI